MSLPVDQFVANFLLSRVLGFQNSIRWKVEQRGGREERGEEHKAIWQDREGGGERMSVDEIAGFAAICYSLKSQGAARAR